MKKILALLGVISVLALSGCGKVDNAATIGDITISTASAQAIVDEVLAERTKVDTSQMQLENGETLLRNQLNFQLLLAGFAEIAKELSIQVTSSEIAGRRAQIVEQVGGAEALPTALVSASITPADLDGYLRAVVTTEKLGQALVQTGVAEAEVQTRVQELLINKLNQLKIKVNPRYGKWDVTTGQIVAADPAGDVVTPSNE